jgi:uncharacterized protein (TIGR03086 family)
MTSGDVMVVLAGGVALIERAMNYTLGSLVLVSPQLLARPTPCRQWDLRALLLHMNDSLLTLHEAIAVGHLSVDPRPGGAVLGADYGDPHVDPVATLRNRACAMIGAWANARGGRDIAIADRGLAPAIVAATGAVEVAVHGWDVARACGTDRPLPPALAADLLELCPLLVNDEDRPARFAAQVGVPSTAGAGERLLAFLGRAAN